jgi:DNA-binding transcriptional ArsR family regulator
MSARALFVPSAEEGSGSYWFAVSQRIAGIKREDGRHAADEVWKAIVDFLPGDRASFTITDRMLRQSSWLADYSYRFIQKGLKALQDAGIIDRERRRGRRKIIVLDRLRAGQERQKKQGSPAAPAPSTATTRPMATPNLQDRAIESELASKVAPLELTIEEEEEAQAVLERSKKRREAEAARLRPRPRVAAPSHADGSPGTAAQAALEARRAQLAVIPPPDDSS